MKITVQTWVENDINIDGITLLSTEEYVRFKKNIVNVGRLWWLRSPGDKSYYAADVYYDGSVYYCGRNVNNARIAVRPALIINPASFHLEIGSKIKVADYLWTVISDEYALCDEIIGQCCFRKDWKAKNANVYKASDIKKYVENWWAEQVKKGE